MLASTLPALAAPVEFPVLFWGPVSSARATELVDGVNAIYAANGTALRLRFVGVGPAVEGCEDLFQVGGVNIAIVSLSALPPGAAEVAASNGLPLGANSSFCGEIGEPFLAPDLPSPYPANGAELILAHALGHMLSLGHTPGTVMNAALQGATPTLDEQQISIVNIAAAQAAVPPATAGSASLLLGPFRRFRVTASFRTAQGSEGEGIPVALTEWSGYFWFFTADNTEVIVKMRNACAAPFERFWVFASGLTNVQVSLSVTDAVASNEWEHVNPLGRLFQTVADTNAFATCP